MSRLNELITELCPDGVEYKTLDTVSTIERGVRVVKSQLYEDGPYPVFQNCLAPMGYYDDFNCGEKMTYVISAGAAGEIGFSETKFWAADDCLIIKNSPDILNKYIYYYLLTQQHFIQSKVRRASIPRLSRNVIEKIKVPIPPLEIQSEIVHILDDFSELKAELKEELKARKEQYNYYCNNIYFDLLEKNTPLVKLGDFCDLLTGFPFDSSKFTSSGIQLMRGMNIKRGVLDFSEENNRYWINSDGLEKYLLNPDDIVISMDGSLVGKSYAVVPKEKLPLLLVQRVTRVRSSKANIHYVYHYLANGAFTKYVELRKTKGAIPHISLKDIREFPIPLPDLTVQNKIADELDKLEKLCTSLTSGLPAEIEAREKQYEYYRDLLLTFKPKVTK